MKAEGDIYQGDDPLVKEAIKDAEEWANMVNTAYPSEEFLDDFFKQFGNSSEEAIDNIENIFKHDTDIILGVHTQKLKDISHLNPALNKYKDD